MLDPLLRPVKDRLLVPVARQLGGVAPGLITATGLVVGLAAGAAGAYRAYGVGVGCWILSRVLDGLDGVQARTHRRQSDLGGYVDQVSDFLIYAAVPVGLVIGRPEASLAMPALWLLASFYVNAASWMYLSAILERRGLGATIRGEQTTITMPDGLIGGSETILFYLAFFLVPAHLAGLFIVMAVLVGITAVQRVAWALQRL
ncbi:MAG TPA: CDP-alcohol phosphatidyltransferase family protein [Gemmatimonadales bacterium]|nr:CDP-alcohol phosphatidyltransferase family protein [Gemmatimonadales bacterium]